MVSGRVLEMLGSRGVSVKAVRPCVPRHRVTHLHSMPSRITRNSHRPRASDRTMVASEATSSLAALSNSMASSASAEKLTRMDKEPNFSRGTGSYSGLDFEKESRPPVEAELFFLTSLFIERFDRMVSEMRMFRQLRQSGANAPPRLVHVKALRYSSNSESNCR